MADYFKTCSYWACILIAACCFCGCGSTGENRKMPVFEVLASSLSRAIDDQGADSLPIDVSSTYYLNDPEVISSVKLADISGEHHIRWDWFRPGKKLYHSTDNQRLSIDRNAYHRKMCIWHRISLANEKAVQYPGEWFVEIYIDNRLISSRSFDLKPEFNIEHLPATAKALKPSDWALIIGIETYADLPNVTYAGNDARLVKKYFNRILGVPRKTSSCCWTAMPPKEK